MSAATISLDDIRAFRTPPLAPDDGNISLDDVRAFRPKPAQPFGGVDFPEPQDAGSGPAQATALGPNAFPVEQGAVLPDVLARIRSAPSVLPQPDANAMVGRQQSLANAISSIGIKRPQAPAFQPTSAEQQGAAAAGPSGRFGAAIISPLSEGFAGAESNWRALYDHFSGLVRGESAPLSEAEGGSPIVDRIVPPQERGALGAVAQQGNLASRQVGGLIGSLPPMLADPRSLATMAVSGPIAKGLSVAAEPILARLGAEAGPEAVAGVQRLLASGNTGASFMGLDAASRADWSDPQAAMEQVVNAAVNGAMVGTAGYGLHAAAGRVLGSRGAARGVEPQPRVAEGGVPTGDADVAGQPIPQPTPESASPVVVPNGGVANLAAPDTPGLVGDRTAVGNAEVPIVPSDVGLSDPSIRSGSAIDVSQVPPPPETPAQASTVPEPGVFYHGTGTSGLTKERLDPFLGNHESLFGHGIYLTDSPDIAAGYAKARGRKTGSPEVYRAEVNPSKTLDLEQPATPDVVEAIRRGTSAHPELTDAVNEAAKEPGSTPESIMLALRKATSELSHQEQIPTSEFVENYQVITDELKNLGYQAVTHTGGKRTGKPPHRVLIVLDPEAITSFKPKESPNVPTQAEQDRQVNPAGIARDQGQAQDAREREQVAAAGPSDRSGATPSGGTGELPATAPGEPVADGQELLTGERGDIAKTAQQLWNSPDYANELPDGSVIKKQGNTLTLINPNGNNRGFATLRPDGRAVITFQRSGTNAPAIETYSTLLDALGRNGVSRVEVHGPLPEGHPWRSIVGKLRDSGFHVEDAGTDPAFYIDTRRSEKAPQLTADPATMNVADLRREVTAAGDTPVGMNRAKLAAQVAGLRAEPDWAQGVPTKELRKQAREAGVRDRGTRPEVVRVLADTKVSSVSQPAVSPTGSRSEPSQESLPSQSSPQSTESAEPRNPEQMNLRDLRAELKASGRFEIPAGIKRADLVSGVKLLRELTAKEEAGAPTAESPKAAGRDPNSDYGPPDAAMGAASKREISSPTGPSLGATIASGVSKAAKFLRDKVVGTEFRHTNAVDKEAAQALAKYTNAGKDAQKAMAADWAAKVMPEDFADEKARREFGTALLEGQLRGLRKSLTDEGKTAEAAQVRTAVGQKDSPFRDEAAYQKYLKDNPEKFRAHIQGPQALTDPWHKQLGGKKRAGDPATGAFINTEAVRTDSESKTGISLPSGNQTATLKQGSRHNKTFSGTAAAYEVDYQKQLVKMMSNYPEIAKREAIAAMAKSGAAMERTTTQGRPMGDEWKDAVKVPVDIHGVPRFDHNGEVVGARTHRVDLYFKDPKVAREFRGAFNTDLTESTHPLTAAIVGAQLAAPTDAIAHAGNWAMVLGGLPEGDPGFKGIASDIARQIPGVDLADAGIKFAASVHQALSDSAEYRRQVAKLFEIGSGRPGLPEPETALGKKAASLNPLRWMGEAMHTGDTAVRTALLRVGEEAQKNGMMARGDAPLREFINSTLGNYNPRAMTGPQRLARSTGLSPFIVAGRNFNRYAIRKVTQMPAYQAASESARLRMVSTAIAGTALSVGLPAIINYVRTGNAAPKGIPVGALYVQTKQDGSVEYFDPQRFTGLRRGLRAFGIEGAVQAIRDGRDTMGAAKAAALQAAQTAAGPWTGPAVQVGVGAMTGKDTGGFPISQDLHGKGGSGAQFAENVKGSLEHVNPILRYLTDTKQKTYQDAAGEYLRKIMGSVGFYEVTTKDRTAHLRSASH